MDERLIVWVIGGLILVAWVWVAAGRKSTAARELADALGLDYEPPDLFGAGGAALGSIDGIAIRVTAYESLTTFPNTTVSRVTRVHFSVAAGLPPGIDLLPAEQGFSAIQIGDSDFDSVFAIRGERSAILARLTHGLRSRIVALGRRGILASSDGKTTFAMTPKDAADVRAALEEAVAIAKQLAKPPAADALVENVSAEPLLEVRARSFETILRTDDPVLREAACRAALRDPKLQLLAAIHLPESFHAVVDDPPLRANEIDGWEDERVKLAMAGLLARGNAALPVVLALWRRVIKSPERERLIIDALGDIADVSIVAEMRERYANLLPDDYGSHAKRAIAKIQARAQGEAGAVSLSESAPGGALSIAQTAGAVSIANGSKG